MENHELVALLAGLFILSFGLTVYRLFFRVLGAAAGLAIWSVVRGPIVQFPGLREHPGTASVLILIVLCTGGVFLVTRFRRLFAFLGGFGTGVILAGMVELFFSGGSILAEPLQITRMDPMGLLAGLVAGVLFLLFERMFAVILTTSLGSYLCFWAVGGRWTFMFFFLAGLVIQLFVFARLGKGKRDGQKSADNLDSRDKGTA